MLLEPQSKRWKTMLAINTTAVIEGTQIAHVRTQLPFVIWSPCCELGN